jgi:tetratricopeptide (TPR) repeat protein
LYRTVPPPDDDPTLGGIVLPLAGLYGARGNWEAAKRLLSAWDQRIQRLAPPDLQWPPRTGEPPQMQINHLIQALKRQPASPFRDSMLKYLEPMAIPLGPQSTEIIRKGGEMRRLIDAGRYPEAERLLVEMIDYLRAKHDDSGVWLFRCQLANVCRKQGKYAEAEVTARQVLEELGHTTDPSSVRMVRPLTELAYALIEQKKFAAAEPYLRQALTIQEREAPNTFARFELLSLLGECLVGLQKYAEAEPLLLSAYEGQKAKGLAVPLALNLVAQSKHPLLDTTQRLVDLYTAWGKRDEAAKWRAERAELLWSIADVPSVVK